MTTDYETKKDEKHDLQTHQTNNTRRCTQERILEVMGSNEK